MRRVFAILIIFIFLCRCEPAENPIYETVYSAELTAPSHVKNGVSSSVNVLIKPSDANATSAELFIDGKSYSKTLSKPFQFDVSLSDINTGEHSLFATITFTSGKIINTNETKFVFIVSLTDIYKGGVVVKVTDGGLHGLIAARQDVPGGLLGKYKYGAYNENYQAFSMDDGLENTNKFIGKYNNDYAAIACLNLTLNGFDDWYLPAYNEYLLFEPYRALLNIPERGGNIYWTSTGSSSSQNKAFVYSFGGMIGNPVDIQASYYARPCRRF